MKSQLQKLVLLIAVLALQQGMFAQKKIKSDPCIEIDFCESSCENALRNKLSGLNLKKGDFFTVKIKNINPYRYNIQVTTKNDTLKAGKEPALFTAFMDISTLGTLAGNILNTAAAFAPATNFKDKQASTELDPGQQKTKQENNKERKKTVRDSILSIEKLYNRINECYSNSSLRILNMQVDCFHKINSGCYTNESCECVQSDQKSAISLLMKRKDQVLKTLDSLTQYDIITKEEAKVLKDELNSKKYSHAYLNSIYTKTYSNFLIADNAAFLSNYYSFPIQVQGDILELKIDITPKGAGKEEEKKEEDKSSNTNTLSNQSPVTININTKDTASAKAAKSSGGDAKADDGLHSAEELKTTMPAATRNYHLNYKFHTSRGFYGFSSGFFVDGLKDDHYTNKPVDPSDPNTGYMLIKEKQESFGKFGVMAAVNGGCYIGRKRNWFAQAFAGPGLTIETKLQPRLLAGLGFGAGGQNKFSVNAGAAFGQVKKLSGIFNRDTSYSSPQTDLYYTTNQLSWFFSINYIFDLRKE